MPAARSRLLAVGLAVGLAGVALGRRLPGGLVVRGDSPELTLVALHHGVAHAPGYPLWTDLAALWLGLGWADPAVGLSWLGLGMMVLAVALVADLAQRSGARPAAAGLAACWALLPPHWGAVLAPEVYALELLLWAGALWAHGGEHHSGPRWGLAAGLLAALAAGHRPTGLLLVGVVLAADRDRRAVLQGLALGGLLALLDYGALFVRAADPEAGWVAALLPGRPLAWLAGDGLNQSVLGGGNPVQLLQRWGAQASLWALGTAALLVPADDSARLPRRALAGAALGLGLWALLWGVSDAEAVALPLFLLATLGWAGAVGRWRGVGSLGLGAAVGMAVVNGPATGDTPGRRAVLGQARATLPETTVVIVDDWTWRGALVLTAPALQVVPEGADGACEPPERWVPGATRWSPEQRRELALPAAVVVWGPGARSCAAAAGWTVETPEEGRPWSWARAPD